MKTAVTGETSIKYLLLPVFFGLSSTLFTYRGFGLGDHIEQLPLILKELDNSLFVNDFFVSSGHESFARRFYSIFIAYLAGSKENLPFLFYTFTCIANVAIAIITYLFTRRLYKNNMAGAFASATVMSAMTFGLGWNATIFFTQLIPAALAIPFLFTALYAAAGKKILTGVLCCCFAMLFHPLLGLETGAILIFVYIINRILYRQGLGVFLNRSFLAAVLVFILSALLAIPATTGETVLTTGEFVHILAYFRHPHHYVPSAISISEYCFAGLFLLSVCISFACNYRKMDGEGARFILIILFIILLLALGGYFFVEVFPIRLWAAAQTLRLLFYIKWLGLIVVPGTIATTELAFTRKALYSIGMVHPYTIFSTAIISNVRNRRNMFHGIWTHFFIIGVLLLLIWEVISFSYVCQIAFFLLCIALAKGYKRFFGATAAFFLLFVAVVYATKDRFYYTWKYASRTESIVDGWKAYFKVDKDFDAEAEQLMTYAKQKTNKNAVFLTPPGWGFFRVHAERAIVVDFKAFPFSDAGMKGWYDRMTQVCGNVTNGGFKVLEECTENYRAIDDDWLVKMKERYNASYAVLYRETPTGFSIVYSNDKYKIVAIP